MVQRQVHLSIGCQQAPVGVPHAIRVLLQRHPLGDLIGQAQTDDFLGAALGVTSRVACPSCQSLSGEKFSTWDIAILTLGHEESVRQNPGGTGRPKLPISHNCVASLPQTQT